MAPSLSREFLLAAACTIWPPSDRRTEAIREAAAGPLDWDRFLRVVMRHRVVGLVHNGLTRAQPAVPPAIAREIGAQAAALVRQNLALAAEGLRLQRLFAEADLPVVFIKGVSLAILAYGDLGLRHGRDLDLVVLPELTLPAAALLEFAGYRRSEPPASFSEAQVRMWLLRCKELTYVHKERRLIVELHCRLFNNSRLMSKMPVAGPLRIVAVTEELGLRTFGEDDLFAYLCAHGAFHCWFRLKWLADIGALLTRQPEGPRAGPRTTTSTSPRIIGPASHIPNGMRGRSGSCPTTSRCSNAPTPALPVNRIRYPPTYGNGSKSTRIGR